MKVTVVVDTSYLLELLKIGKNWSEVNRAHVMARFGVAQQNSWRQVIPRGVIYEVGNAIGHVKARDHRVKLADDWRRTVASAVSGPVGERVFEVYPWVKDDPLSDLVSAWADRLRRVPPGVTDQGDVGLVDWSVFEVARQMKEKWPMTLVHIWALDRSLKGLEPDRESGGFSG